MLLSFAYRINETSLKKDSIQEFLLLLYFFFEEEKDEIIFIDEENVFFQFDGLHVSVDLAGVRACVLVCRLKTGHIFCAFGMFFIFIIIMIVINLILVCSFYFQHFSCILFAFLQIQSLLFCFGCVCIDVFVVRRTCNIVLKLIWFDSNKKVKHITHAHNHKRIHSTKTKRKC